MKQLAALCLLVFVAASVVLLIGPALSQAVTKEKAGETIVIQSQEYQLVSAFTAPNAACSPINSELTDEVQVTLRGASIPKIEHTYIQVRRASHTSFAYGDRSWWRNGTIVIVYCTPSLQGNQGVRWYYDPTGKYIDLFYNQPGV